MIDRTPSNSTVERPFSPVVWNTGAAGGNAALRSRPKPLLSCHTEIGWPSVTGSFCASNQSWRPVVTGGAEVPEPVIRPVAVDGADVWPAPFVAVTTTRIRAPMSPEPSVYVALVAPSRFAQLAPELSHRCHW